MSTFFHVSISLPFYVVSCVDSFNVSVFFFAYFTVFVSLLTKFEFDFFRLDSKTLEAHLELSEYAGLGLESAGVILD